MAATSSPGRECARPVRGRSPLSGDYEPDENATSAQPWCRRDRKVEGPEAPLFRGTSGPSVVGATGFEPATTCTPSEHGPNGRGGNAWQRLAPPRYSSASRRARIPRRGTDRTPWHGKRCAGGARRSVRVGSPHRRRGRPAPIRLPRDRVPAVPGGTAPARPRLECHPGARAVACGVPAPRRGVNRGAR